MLDIIRLPGKYLEVTRTQLGKWMAQASASAQDEYVDYVGFDSFPRLFQYNNYSCYARSVHATLQHFERKTTYKRILRECKTDGGGTEEVPVVRFLRGFKLKVRPRSKMTFTDLWNALASDAVVFAYLDGDHVGVVYGATATHVYLADPSLIRSVRTCVPKKTFLERWDRSGLVVRE